MKTVYVLPQEEGRRGAKVAPRAVVFTEELQKEFRELYTDIFGNKETVEETPEVLAHPGYKRYQQLAPWFYSMMVKKRREIGWRS